MSKTGRHHQPLGELSNEAHNTHDRVQTTYGAQRQEGKGVKRGKWDRRDGETPARPPTAQKKRGRGPGTNKQCPGKWEGEVETGIVERQTRQSYEAQGG